MENILEQVKKDNVKSVQLQFTDLLGMVKSVTIPVRHLSDALDHGMWFDGSSIEGFMRIHESDMYLKPDTRTYAIIPWLVSEKGNTARFICDVYKPNGEPFEGDPRHILKKVLKEAEEMGLMYNTGPELEFFLFKGSNGIGPLPHDKGSYFDLTSDLAYDIREEMIDALERFNIDVETAHHEVAIGQHEIDFKYSDALTTADNAVTLKFVLKAIAQKHDLHATFMPKPIIGINGSGMHVHQSLFDIKTGTNVFFNQDDKYRLSKIAYSFMAGQLHHINAMTALLAPTVNSYKRLVPGHEAPVYVSWGRVNRSALIRIPRYSKGRHQSTRIELRCADPSCNPYLAFAVMLKAGLEGIKKEMAVPEPSEENLYAIDDEKRANMNIETLPFSLWQALKALRNDKVIQDALGEHTYQLYLVAKTKEWDEYRLQVTQWELDRYLENY